MIGRVLIGFVAGFLSVLLFHQAAIAVGGKFGLLGGTAWSMQPVPPFRVPQVLSGAFFGGLWGVLLAALAPRFGRGLVGAVAVILLVAALMSLVGWYVVLPLKGRSVGAITQQRILVSMTLNAIWGLGTVVLLGLSRRIVR